MFVLDLVPAWFSNRIKRLVKAPKRYLVDPALVAAVLGLGRDAILYGPDMLGRLLDTFVAAQLRAELAASSNDPRLYHLREEQGRREVDLLIETASGQLIAIEVKASATVTASDPRHVAKHWPHRRLQLDRSFFQRTSRKVPGVSWPVVKFTMQN
jgi:uncharacterized protein